MRFKALLGFCSNDHVRDVTNRMHIPFYAFRFCFKGGLKPFMKPVKNGERLKTSNNQMSVKTLLMYPFS